MVITLRISSLALLMRNPGLIQAASTSFQRDLPGCLLCNSTRNTLSLLHCYCVLSRLILYRLDSYFEMLYNTDPITKGWHYCRKIHQENQLEPRRGGIMTQPIMPPLWFNYFSVIWFLKIFYCGKDETKALPLCRNMD